MRYRLIIFDFDGTLADSFSIFVEVFNKLADEHGFNKMPAQGLEQLRGFSAQEMVKNLGVPAWKLPMIATYMRKRISEQLDRVRLFNGVDTLLPRLVNGGLKLSIVTSNSEENVRAILGRQNAALIDYYECGAALFGKKSKLKKVLKRSGITADQAICIGDEIRDIEAAESVGIPFGSVAWGYTKIESLRAHAPIEEFHTIDEIAERLVQRQNLIQ